ncbi:hypothetical protein LINPERHAP1_LOCUS29110 [Linum perenne]
MAGGGNFIHRVVSYVVNELVVNSLANSPDLRACIGFSGCSPSFQRFAVRTSKKLEQVSSLGRTSRISEGALE